MGRTPGGRRRSGSADGAGTGTSAAAPDLLPVALGALGASAIAFSPVFVRLADVSPATAAVFRCVYALPVLALLASREGRRAGRRDWAQRRVAFAAGVAFAADLVAFHVAIAAIGAGMATVLDNLQVVVVGLVAWVVLGERPARSTVLAVPLVLVGAILIAGVVGEDAYGNDPATGAVAGLLAGVAYAGYILLLRAGNVGRRHRAATLLDVTVAAALASAVAGVLGGVLDLGVGGLDLVPSWPAHGWLLALALNSQVVAWLLISYALPRLPALVTSVVLLLQPVGAVALGMLLLDETPSTPQLVGVVSVLAGVLAATVGDVRSRRRAGRDPVPAPPPT